MHNGCFPVRPRPQHGESLKGYALRIAYCMGYQTLKELHHVIGVRYSDGAYESSSKAYKPFLNQLAKYLMMDAQELYLHFDCLDDSVVDHARAIKDIRNPRPKVCPECVKSDHGHIMTWKNMQSHHTHCEKHNVELVDICPACNEPLLWISDVFEGCSCWRANWEDMDTVTSVIPLYQQVTAKLSALERKAYLSALYENVVMALRPYDVIEHSFRKMPLVKSSLSNVFEQAYSLMVDSKYRKRFVEQKLNFLKNEMPLLPVESLVIAPAQVEFELAKLQCCLPIKEHIIELPRAINQVGIDAKYLLTKEHLAQLLKMQDEDIASLQQVGVLNAVNPDAKTLLFHMAEANQLAENLLNTAVKPDVEFEEQLHLYLHDAYVIAKRNFCDLGLLFQQFLAGSMTLYNGSSGSIEHLFVDKKQLIEYFEFSFFKQLLYPLSLPKLQVLTCLAGEELNNFVDELSIFPFKVNAKKELYKTDVLKQFFEESILLNRWATLNRVKLSDVYFYLKNYELYPSNRKLEKQGVYVYEQEPKLFKMLRQYLIDVKNSKGELPLFLYVQYTQKNSFQTFPFFC